MRVLAIGVFALLVAADQSASAASCNRGMLWPYVRNPGDCLTDGEIAAGARGVYNGPVDTNPDVGAMQGLGQAPAPVQQPITVNPSGAPVPVAPVARPAPMVNNYAAPAPAAGTAANCTKGALWPFVKKPGDCGTDEVKASDRMRTKDPLCYYRKPGDCQRAEQKTASVATSYSGVGPVATAQAIAASAPAGTVTGDPGAAPASAAPVVPSCTKGPLWPFVKRPGDCATTGDQKRNK